MKKNKYYDYDIKIEEILIDNGMIEECFRLKDLQARKLFLNDEVTFNSVEDIVKHIIRYNAEDREIPAEERQPIYLYVNSVGGDVYAGFHLIDIIKNSLTPVYTVNMGIWFSMGFVIGLSGHKRFSTKHAKFLWHDGMTGGMNSSSKFRDTVEFQNRQEDEIRDFILTNSQITPELYDSKSRIEWYMFADEAKELGVVDYIVGEDCAIDEIV